MKSKVAIVSTLLMWFWGAALGFSSIQWLFTVQIFVLLILLTLLELEAPVLVSKYKARWGNEAFGFLIVLILPTAIYIATFFLGAAITPAENRLCGGWMDSAPYPCSLYEYFRQSVFFGSFVLWPIWLLELFGLSFAILRERR
jgi:hypothetical protein